MKNIIILGATGGVGSLLAEKLSAAGCKCFLLARASDKLRMLAESTESFFYELDCSNFQEVNQAFEEGIKLLGNINVVVNCCGSILLKPAHLVSQEEYDLVIAKNLSTAFAAVRSAGKYLGPNGGSVVLFSSAAAQIGLANHEAIAAAKGAINGLVRSAAATYAGKNIRINAIAPGLTRTPMTANIFNNENSLKMSEKMHALKRLGEPADLVSMTEFLISDQASWITGQIFGVDGGLGSLRTNS